MTKVIKSKFFFPHPKETVWEYLTNSEFLEQWLMENTFQPIVGYKFYFKTNPIPSMTFDGICYCRVLEIIPFQFLSYSWKGGPGNGEISLDTVVVWELVPNERGTDLFLEHSGFGKTEHSNFFPFMRDVWLTHVQKIMTRLNPSLHDTTRLDAF